MRLGLTRREVDEVISAMVPDERRFEEFDIDESNDGFDSSDESIVERWEVSFVVFEQELFDRFSRHLL